MNKIKLIANRETNYVYHMLSVAKCGYDNDYGRKYRELYEEEDLRVLKEHESMITICGGEHCGELHGLLVGEPAQAKVTAKEYYESLLTMIAENTVPEEGRKYIPVVEPIAKVMIKYYDSYVENIWPAEKAELEAYIPQVQTLFDENGFTERAEELTGCKLPTEYFFATMVPSVQGGAEAINISRDQDVFGITKSPRNSMYFMAHEFIVFLLLGEFIRAEVEPGENAWSILEGMAEFYLKQITGGNAGFHEVEDYVRFYEEQVKSGPKTVLELYDAVLEWKR